MPRKKGKKKGKGKKGGGGKNKGGKGKTGRNKGNGGFDSGNYMRRGRRYRRKIAKEKQKRDEIAWDTHWKKFNGVISERGCGLRDIDGKPID
jgi:hypothetical protein